MFPRLTEFLNAELVLVMLGKDGLISLTTGSHGRLLDGAPAPANPSLNSVWLQQIFYRFCSLVFWTRCVL